MKNVEQKKIGLLLTAVVLLLVVWPVRFNWVKKPTDSFPLSYYPMFSFRREGKANMTYLVGVSQDNRRTFLSYKMAGTGGMNQVRKLIRKRAESQPEQLCSQVAKRVSKAPEYAHIKNVKIVKSEFQLAAFFGGNYTPSESDVLCTCAVNAVDK